MTDEADVRVHGCKLKYQWSVHFPSEYFLFGINSKIWNTVCMCKPRKLFFCSTNTHTHHNKTTLVKIIPHFWEKQSHCKADRRCVHWNLQAAQNAIRRRYNQNYTFKKLAKVKVCTTSSVFFLPLLYNATSAPQWSDTAAIHVFNRLNSWQAAGWYIWKYHSLTLLMFHYEVFAPRPSARPSVNGTGEI